MKKHAILAALMALVAMAAVPAMASAVTLTAPAGTALTPGEEISAFSSNLVFSGATSGLQLKCTENRFVGEVETNGAQTSTSKINSATFTGTGGGVCATNVEGVTATVTAVASTLPWIIHFKPKDLWTLTHPIFTATIIEKGVSIGHCTFTATEVGGTYTTSPNPLVFTITSGNFVRIEPGVATCPDATGTLTGSAAVSSTGSAVIAD
jgi:hypothetical protein